MTSRVRLSTFALIVTFIIDVAMVFVCIVTFHERVTFLTLLFLFLFLIISALIYSPLSISADDRYVTVNSILKKHRLRIDQIASIELKQPSMAARRLFAAGGYMGYWGVFRDGELGQYIAYYGRGSDCFLIRMKNGDNYLLGCDNQIEMVNYISHKVISSNGRNK